MKTAVKALFYMTLAATALSVAGCRSSHILVGQTRPAIDPQTVRIYTSPPDSYEEVAMLTSTSSGSWGLTEQQKTSAVVRGFKAEAAELGANGVLILGLNNSNWLQGFGMVREGQAMAIWVDNQKPVTQEELTKGKVVQDCIDQCRSETSKSAAACFDDCTKM